MAERYDPHSVDNVGKFDNAKDPSNDVWAELVTHITGYQLPKRGEVFDTLRSSQGGKLFRMDIRTRSLESMTTGSGFLRDSGQDYDIFFFDSGKRHSIKQARIVFEGRVKSGDEIFFATPGGDDVTYHTANVREGNEFTDYNKEKMSTVPLARYMNGPRAALISLLNGNTGDARFSNQGVDDANVVDLGSFDRAGESFDFAAKFFRDHAVVLKDWEDRFGAEDASWKGEAAEVFRSLIRKVRENYDSYIEAFDSLPVSGDAGTGGTVYSRALSLGRTYLQDAATTLLDAWLAWAKSPYYDPLQVLRYVLDDLAMWVDANNIAKSRVTSTTYHATYPGAVPSTVVTHTPEGDFTQVHPEYGDLTDIANWAKVGDKAVRIWSQGIDEYLGKPASRVQSSLNNHFIDLGGDFTGNVPEPKSTTTVSADYKDEQLKKEKEEFDKHNRENRENQDRLDKQQEAWREEDKKYREQLEKEQREQREKDEAYRDQLAQEQREQREEDKKYRDRLEKEQREQREAAQREAEKQREAVEKNLSGINSQSLSLDRLLNGSGSTTGSGGFHGVNLGGGGPNGMPATQDLSLGGLNGGSVSLRTPTGGSTQLDKGKITNEFPDGSTTAFDPDTGALTTTRPDGTTTITDLGDGLRVTNPDGSVTSLGEDGKLTTTFPDGTTRTIDPRTGQTATIQPDGKVIRENIGNLTDPNGQNSQNGQNGGPVDIRDVITEVIGDSGNLNSGSSGLGSPTGGFTSLDADGDFTTRFKDGSTSSFDPDDGTLTVTDADGKSTTTDLRHGARVTNPDGSLTELDNGKLTTTFPDGSKQVIDPETGIVTITDPHGRTETVDLNDLNASGRDDLSDIFDRPGGSAGGGVGTTSQDFSLPALGGSEGFGTKSQDLSLTSLDSGSGGSASVAGVGASVGYGLSTGGAFDPLSDGSEPSASPSGVPMAGAPGAPGMPGTPGMPMGGAGGMGGGGDRGNGERVRNVLVDAVKESERRNRRRRGPWNRQEDNDTFLTPATRVSTTGGESSERQPDTSARRPTTSAAYLEEDSDVWGTEEGGTPAVIGR